MLAEVMRCPEGYLLLPQNNSSEWEVQCSLGKRKRRASQSKKGLSSWYGSPSSTVYSHLEFQLQEQVMTKVLPFKSRVPGNLVSQGTLQSSTLSKKTGVEKTSPCLSSQYQATTPHPTPLTWDCPKVEPHVGHPNWCWKLIVSVHQCNQISETEFWEK